MPLVVQDRLLGALLHDTYQVLGRSPELTPLLLTKTDPS